MRVRITQSVGIIDFGFACALSQGLWELGRAANGMWGVGKGGLTPGPQFAGPGKGTAAARAGALVAGAASKLRVAPHVVANRTRE